MKKKNVQKSCKPNGEKNSICLLYFVSISFLTSVVSHIEVVLQTHQTCFVYSLVP